MSDMLQLVVEVLKRLRTTSVESTATSLKHIGHSLTRFDEMAVPNLDSGDST